jgi:hypothetical protein
MNAKDVIQECRKLQTEIYGFSGGAEQAKFVSQAMLIAAVDNLTSQVRALKEDMIETYKEEQNQ